MGSIDIRVVVARVYRLIIMKQVFQNLKNGKIELLDIPAPALKPGGVLVSNYFSVISPGTEKEIMQLANGGLLAKARQRPDLVREIIIKAKQEGWRQTWRKVKAKIETDLALGYASAGMVAAVAADVMRFKIGDRVACAGQNYASHSQTIFVPENLCVHIPDDVSFNQAAFTTLGAVALQGIRQARLTGGESAAVIGLGLIGQLTCQILKAYGQPITAIDFNAQRVGLAQKSTNCQGLVLGRDKTNQLRVDAVIISAASQDNQSLVLAGEILRDRGRVVVVGNVKIEIPRREYYKKELSVYLSRSYGPGRYDANYEEKGQDYPVGYVRWTEKRNLEEFLRLLSIGAVEVESLISHEYDISDAVLAYETLKQDKNSLAILLRYPKSFEKIPTKACPAESCGGGTPIGGLTGTAKDIVGLGLIGAGNFMQSIVVPAIKKIPGCRVRAIAAGHGYESQRLAKSLGQGQAVSNWQDVIHCPDVDLVITATRHDLHAVIVKEALDQNKNIHIEKPLCLTESELVEIKQAQANSQANFWVGFNRRFSAYTRFAKETFANHQGLVINYRVSAGSLPANHWVYDPQQGGGRLIGEVCHFVDWLQFMIGAAPRSVLAQALITKQSQSRDDFMLQLNFADGSLGSIIYTGSADRSLPKERIEIFGGGKAMVIDDFSRAEIFSQGRRRCYKFGKQDKGYKQQFIDLVSQIKNKGVLEDKSSELFNVTAAIFAAQKSIRNCRKVSLSEYGY